MRPCEALLRNLNPRPNLRSSSSAATSRAGRGLHPRPERNGVHPRQEAPHASRNGSSRFQIHSPPKPRLVTTRKNLKAPTVFPAFVRRTRLRRGASVFVRRGRLMSAVIARPRRNKRRRNNASPPDGLSPTAHAQSPLQPAEPSPPPVKSETRTKEGWEKSHARTLSPPRVERARVARVWVGAD